MERPKAKTKNKKIKKQTNKTEHYAAYTKSGLIFGKKTSGWKISGSLSSTKERKW